jgi:ketopantoate reductase
LREAEMMRIAVLGGGALGGYFAAHLARADSEKLG